MNRTVTLSILLMAMATHQVQADNNIVPPEIPTAIDLSNHDINRIVCPGKINDLIFSEEKGLTGHFSDNNAFVKFKIEQRGSERIHAATPSELFLVCENTVYTMIANPKDMPSVTLRLAAAQEKALSANIQAFKELPLEKRVLQVIREAYNRTYPSGYRIVETGTPLLLSPEFEILLTQTINIDGIGLKLKELTAKSQMEREARIDEAFFLNAKFSDSLLAVAVDSHILQPGESTRIFVVEQKELDR
jgi:conjugal transfer pilus assembly protein TraK